MITKLTVPAALLERHSAVLGTTGSGKTYAAKGWVEYLICEGRRVCILDPTGVWWGLRLMADGESPGLDVVIFGGDHADVPITPDDGEKVARIIATSNVNAIIDMKGLTPSPLARFTSAFNETLLATNKGVLQLFMDEAHLFAPQSGGFGGKRGAMLASTNNLLSAGRAQGIRVCLMTQRPQKLAKDSLTQAQSLVAMKAVHHLDRKAVSLWAPDRKQGDAMTKRLPMLKTGSGYVWVPDEEYLELKDFPPITTFDSSAEGANSLGLELGDISVDEILAELAPPAKPKKVYTGMAAVVEAQKLQKLLDRLKAENATLTRERDEARAEVRGMRDRLDGMLTELLSVLEHAGQVVGPWDRRDLMGANGGTGDASPGLPEPTTGEPPPGQPEPQTGEPPLSKGARKLLDGYLSAYPAHIKPRTAALRAGQSPKSSALAKNLKELRSGGYLAEGSNGGEKVNARAMGALGIDPAAVAPATIDDWASMFTPATGNLLRAVAAHPHWDKEALAMFAGISPTSSGLGSGLKMLMDFDLIDRDQDGLYSLREGLL